MDKDSLREQLEEYVELISRIRVLSAVQMEAGSKAEEYGKCLREDYQEIGLLGVRSRAILKETIYPLLEQEEPISHDILCVLQDFCEMLLEPVSGEELDLLLLFEVSDRLLEEFDACKDDNRYVKQLHIHINACYSNVNRTARISISKDMSVFFRDMGLLAAERLCEYVYNKEQFSLLNQEARHAALLGVRFYSALYDTYFADEQINDARYRALVDALSLSEDAFYIDAMNNYDWELHKCRCIEHMGQLTERGNRWGFTKEQCEGICEWLAVLEQMWNAEPDKLSRMIPESHYRLILLRNSYFAEKIDKQSYQKKLLELYDQYSSESYDMYAVQTNVLVPAEYFATLRGEEISARTEAILHRIYDQVIDYLIHSVNMDAFNFLQEYLVGFLEEFIEISGIMSFEDMVLHCLAALHPPTYVHSVQVADISKCLAEHLLKFNPGMFSEEEIADRSEFLRFVYHCALCHDFGKITMIDTIFIYGRNLLDSEFDIIKMHPLMGSELLSRYRSTEKYAEIAKHHHVWFNQQKGYPLCENEKPSVISNIVEVADCIDAATDSIGRSYVRGKGLDEICEELFAGSGEHYAPYVVELLKKEEVLEDLNYLLTVGRQNKYQSTYLLLNGSHCRK